MGTRRNELLREYYLRIVRAVQDTGEQIAKAQPINLTGWVPPTDWEERILSEPVTQGISITVDFEPQLNLPDVGLDEQIRSLVTVTRAVYPLGRSTRTPLSVLVLACLKHQSPLPADFWRSLIFKAGV